MTFTTRPPITTSVRATATKDALLSALFDLADHFDFDHRQWSEWEAERLESLAKRIRDGYAARDWAPKTPENPEAKQRRVTFGFDERSQESIDKLREQGRCTDLDKRTQEAISKADIRLPTDKASDGEASA